MFTRKETIDHLKKHMHSITVYAPSELRGIEKKINECDGVYFAAWGADYTASKPRFYIGLLVAPGGQDIVNRIYAELSDISNPHESVIFSVQRKDVSFVMRTAPTYANREDVFFITCEVPTGYDSDDETHLSKYLTKLQRVVTLACSEQIESEEFTAAMQKMKGD